MKCTFKCRCGLTALTTVFPDLQMKRCQLQCDVRGKEVKLWPHDLMFSNWYLWTPLFFPVTEVQQRLCCRSPPDLLDRLKNWSITVTELVEHLSSSFSGWQNICMNTAVSSSMFLVAVARIPSMLPVLLLGSQSSLKPDSQHGDNATKIINRGV